jgi:hypothetical protein
LAGVLDGVRPVPKRSAGPVGDCLPVASRAVGGATFAGSGTGTDVSTEVNGEAAAIPVKAAAIAVLASRVPK